MWSTTDFLEWFYRMPEPAPRVRTKPMEVICVGPPRSGTESLQQGLLKLGYDYTYHGWDITDEDPPRMQAWARLAKRKWWGSPEDDGVISAADFDAIIGNCVAVTDAAASCFAPELIAAYPEAKVVLNIRKNLDSWHRSVNATVANSERSWWYWFRCFFTAEDFWAWHIYYYYLWRGLFHAPDGRVQTGIVKNGKRMYREHCNMIRGLVPKERLLEWSVEEGWDPLCKFLGKEIPNEPFPHINAGENYYKHAGTMIEKRQRRLFTNMIVSCSALAVGVGAVGWQVFAMF